jgi:hypothetical protein
MFTAKRENIELSFESTEIISSRILPTYTKEFFLGSSLMRRQKDI